MRTSLLIEVRPQADRPKAVHPPPEGRRNKCQRHHIQKEVRIANLFLYVVPPVTELPNLD